MLNAKHVGDEALPVVLVPMGCVPILPSVTCAASCPMPWPGKADIGWVPVGWTVAPMVEYVAVAPGVPVVV
jgi:hypothetical protein